MKRKLINIIKNYKLKFVVGGNTQNYNESELIKFHFHENSISSFKENLIPLATEMIDDYTEY